MTTCKGYLCVDAGGTFFKYCVFDPTGERLTEINEKPVTSDGGLHEIISLYEKIILEQKENFDIIGMGISTPGPFDYVNRMSLMEHKFRSLYKFKLGEELEKFFDKKIPIIFISDTNAFLAGVYTGKENALGVTIGTGLGLALSASGKLLTNEKGGPLEVIYNLPVNEYIAEDYVSGRGIINFYEKIGGKKGYKAKDIAQFAKEGDKKALQVYSQMGSVLGKVTKDIVKKYDIKKFFLGGQISKSFELFEKDLKKEILQPIEYIPALSGNAALTGIFNTIKKVF